MLLAVGTVAASARDSAPHERMKQCNIEAKAKSLAGDARRQFMKGCLSTHEAPKRALNRQQEKMKACNVDAKSKRLQGADRRHFMS
ncbi:MAG: PsiF family protein, partial [Sciscionella sp.]